MIIRRAAIVAIALSAMAACTADEPGTRVTPAMLEAGRASYVRACAPCHGTSGRGDGPSAIAFKPRNHTDAEVMNKLSDADIARVIQNGGAEQGMPYMPAQPNFRGEELLQLVAYVRSLHRDEVTHLDIEAAAWR
jgi:mono/diheme cytochrome c family protein